MPYFGNSQISWNICVTNDHGYVPLVGSTSRSFPHSWLITGFVARLTRQEPLVEKELLGILGSVASLLAEPSIKDIMIGTTSSEISYQPRDIYSIYRCSWNVATYRRKVQNGKNNDMMMISSLY
jgi:hypothetical protein